jgi:hypothetical protein
VTHGQVVELITTGSSTSGHGKSGNGASIGSGATDGATTTPGGTR